jgi:hypothetical protein
MNMIKTKLGAMRARVIDDDDYPAIMIELNVHGRWIEYCWVEVDQYDPEAPVLKIHAYNSNDDEPVYNGEATREDIESGYIALFGAEGDQQ